MPSALAFQSATHNIISFIILTNMSISDNKKSLDKCILWVLKCVAMKHTLNPSHGYCTDMCLHSGYSTESLSGHNVRTVCTVWSYVCSVCTERTVWLVPLIPLAIVNELVDTSAQIKVTKGPERGQIELSKLLSQHFCCSNNCISMDGQDVIMGDQYGCRFNPFLTSNAKIVIYITMAAIPSFNPI